jgi:hypothetical protein
MKNLKIACILLIIASCVAFTPLVIEWSAGVKHSDMPPSVSPKYNTMPMPSLLHFDSTQQAFWVNNRSYGWWLLLSPYERYVRGHIFIRFNNETTYQYTAIEAQIRTQAGTGAKLNGFYLVKFLAVNDMRDYCGVDFTNAPVPVADYPLSNGDYLIFRYFRDKLVQVQHINDNTQLGFNNLYDSLAAIRQRIDTLKSTPIVNTTINEKNLLYIPMPIYECNQDVLFNGGNGVVLDENFTGAIFNVPPQMVGDTLIGMQVSMCMPSNYILMPNVLRFKADGTNQYCFFHWLTEIPDGQTNKYFSDVWDNLGQHNGVLQLNDRLFCFVRGSKKPATLPPTEGFRPAKGLTYTLVVKPHN